MRSTAYYLDIPKMKKINRLLYGVILCGYFPFVGYAQPANDTLNFETFFLDESGYFNGSTLGGATSFTHQYCTFENSYTDWGGSYSWYGFSVSKVQDSITSGHFNQYAAYPHHGSNGSEKYGVSYLVPEDYSVPASVYGGQKIEFDTLRILKSIDIANTTYAVRSMREGDQFAKVFGSPYDANGQPDGTDGKDWFLLEIVPLNQADQPIGNTIKHYLADFRFDEANQNYIDEEWATVQLNGVEAKKLQFYISSSDVGQNGLNTPAYFAFDNLITTRSPINITIDSTVCDSQLPFTWNNQPISQAGTYTHTETTANGSDSITTLVLTVQSLIQYTIDSFVCEAQLPFTWNNQPISQAGTYTHTETTANGCDSTTTLILTVQSLIEHAIDSTVCDSQLPFTWNNQLISQAGTYIHTETTTNGCDSTTTLTLTVYLSSEQTIDSTINESDLPFTWNNQAISQAGTYTHTETTANGCDSTTTLILSVIPTSSASLSKTPNFNAKIYPNPASHTLTVEIDREARIQLFNTVGQIVLLQSLHGKTDLDVRNLPTGLYLLSISKDQATIVEKVIIR